MGAIRQIMRHPAGRIGVAVGFTAGVVAAFAGGAGKALLCVGLFAFLDLLPISYPLFGILVKHN